MNLPEQKPIRVPEGAAVPYEEIDTDYTDDPVCPYCGEEQADSGELFADNNESAETWCQHCEKEIVITQHISVHYCTYKPDDPELNSL